MRKLKQTLTAFIMTFFVLSLSIGLVGAQERDKRDPADQRVLIKVTSSDIELILKSYFASDSREPSVRKTSCYGDSPHIVCGCSVQKGEDSKVCDGFITLCGVLSGHWDGHHCNFMGD